MSHCPNCGTVIGGNSRSIQDHRRFFGLIRAAFHQWSESHAFQPTSEEQLRAWALIQAGWTDVATVEIPASYSESETARAAFRAAIDGAVRALDGPSGYHELRIGDASLSIVTPRSLRFDVVGQREFGRVREAVEGVIEGALGVPAEQLLREKAA
jgi:hypothetical protein